MVCTSHQNTNINIDKVANKVFSKVTICEAINCENEATENIEVRAGKHGIVKLSICNKCVRLFGTKGIER